MDPSSTTFSSTKPYHWERHSRSRTRLSITPFGWLPVAIEFALGEAGWSTGNFPFFFHFPFVPFIHGWASTSEEQFYLHQAAIMASLILNRASRVLTSGSGLEAVRRQLLSPSSSLVSANVRSLSASQHLGQAANKRDRVKRGGYKECNVRGINVLRDPKLNKVSAWFLNLSHTHSLPTGDLPPTPRRKGIPSTVFCLWVCCHWFWIFRGVKLDLLLCESVLIYTGLRI